PGRQDTYSLTLSALIGISCCRASSRAFLNEAESRLRFKRCADNARLWRAKHLSPGESPSSACDIRQLRFWTRSCEPEQSLRPSNALVVSRLQALARRELKTPDGERSAGSTGTGRKVFQQRPGSRFEPGAARSKSGSRHSRRCAITQGALRRQRRDLSPELLR